MNKKGQLTIFIIAAILIVALSVLVFLFIKPQNEVLGVSTDSINNFVSSCIEQTAEDAVYEIGQNGGYYLPAAISTHSGIPYYYRDNKNLMPTLERVENQISLYIKENLFFCTKNFIQFNNYNISQGNIDVKTTIHKDRVNVKVNYPLTISQGEEVSRIEDFEEDIDVRLGIIYNSIAEVINSSMYGICITCIYDLTAKNDLYAEMLDYNENTIVIVFIDKNSKINREDYKYVYAVEA